MVGLVDFNIFDRHFRSGNRQGKIHQFSNDVHCKWRCKWRGVGKGWVLRKTRHRAGRGRSGVDWFDGLGKGRVGKNGEKLNFFPRTDRIKYEVPRPHWKTPKAVELSLFRPIQSSVTSRFSKMILNRAHACRGWWIIFRCRVA